MGIFDKIKDAKNAVTGGAADVSMEVADSNLEIGKPTKVKVTVVSLDSEVKSEGIFVDILGREHGDLRVKHQCRCGTRLDYTETIGKNTYKNEIPMCGAFTLRNNQTKVVEGEISIPVGQQPTYIGTLKHEWSVRGRLEAFGNDPDSGFQKIHVR